MPLPQRRRKRKPSPDKEIESILVLKDTLEDQVFVFNAELGVLRQQMGALRRGIGGLGDRRSNLPPSHVTQPIHPKVSTFISQVANRYKALGGRFASIQELAQEIIRKQDELSRERAQRPATAPQEQHTVTQPLTTPGSPVTPAVVNQTPSSSPGEAGASPVGKIFSE